MLNDEAHHCYQDKPLEDDVDLDAETKREAAERNEGARVWFKGLLAIKRKVGIKAIYDLSATPFYLSGSGYNEGYIFPWVVSCILRSARAVVPLVGEPLFRAGVSHCSGRGEPLRGRGLSG